MTPKSFVLICILSLTVLAARSQQKGAAVKKTSPESSGTLNIPVSNADLGAFPYFKTLNNFTATDSQDVVHNQVYFYDGNKFFTVDGHVSVQNLNVKDDNKSIASEAGCIEQFDKIIATLGGIRVFKGRFPQEQLQKISGEDIVALAGKGQVAPSAHYGVVEYVVKTPDKEVWVQLQPYSLGSKFYTLLVVEKTAQLVSLNTTKNNQVLDDLDKSKKAVLHLSFEPDKAVLLSESKDEILSILGVFQAHPDWKLKLEMYTAPVGKADYNTDLTEKRAAAVKNELVTLGIGSAAVVATGMGDQKPLVPNDTEQGRLTNTRMEITRQ